MPSAWVAPSGGDVLSSRASGTVAHEYLTVPDRIEGLRPKQLLADAGLQSDVIHAELRMEGGLPVAGLAVRAGKTVAGGTTPPLPLGRNERAKGWS